jgi:hypothetical protein
MNSDLKIVWKEAAVALLRYYPGNFPEELRNAMKNSGYRVSQPRFEPSTSQI